MKLRIAADGEESVRGWLVHPFTQAVLHSAKREQQEALLRLLSTCGQSDDVKVVAALKYYEGLQMLIDITEGKRE